MRAALICLFCMVVAGCGSNLATVSGTVTLDGRPLAANDRLSASVEFSPEDGHGTTAIGYLDENGKYTLSSGSRKGVMPGKYLVSISATEIIPPKIAGEAPSGRSVTPRKYAESKSSGFTADVAPGSNTFDYALASKGS